MNAFPSFTDFFQAIWEKNPYPWQIRLAESACQGQWPSCISIPTGSGKTACLDIAVYALAKQAASPDTPRTAPVRIVLAVNRRVVVDGAFDRAQKICKALKEALGQTEATLHPVALALWNLASADPSVDPLLAFPLRGGSYSDHAWARSPFQPTILSTTLDQLGSRLLFRGYGVSNLAKPLHAALLANDALLILDEAHTATAFQQTLRAIRDFRNLGQDLHLPFGITELSATPGAADGEVFELASEDRDQATCPDLYRRLGARKPATLHPVKGAKGSNRHKAIAKQVDERTKDFFKQGVRRILVVVNRVATAQACVEKMKAEDKGKANFNADVELLTGRMRPLDRAAALEQLENTHGILGGPPAADGRNLVLVATQCVEVGADFDFDALITELAPLDCLRQRFGRLNRAGRTPSAPAAILAPEEALDKPDAIYGSCLPAVWKWLNAQGAPVDFGVNALQPSLPASEQLSGLLAPASPAPVLLPSHLDLLCQTAPRPQVEPEAACFIHGLEKPLATISVVFRHDGDLRFPENGEVHLEADSLARLEATPPFSGEAAEVPLYQAQKWLAGEDLDQTSDTFEGGEEPGRLGYGGDDSRLPRAIHGTPDGWRGLTRPGNLKAGEFLILPAGAVRPGLVSLPGELADDQYEAAHLFVRDRLRIRLTVNGPNGLPNVFTDAGQPANEAAAYVLPAVEGEGGGNALDLAALRQNLSGLLKTLAKLPATDARSHVKTNSLGWKIDPYGWDGAILWHPDRAGVTPWPLEPEAGARQGDDSAAENGLYEHQAAVAKELDRSLRALPLGRDSSLVEAMLSAARWHDLGKADPRFQAVLHGVPYYASLGKPLLAKSGDQAAGRGRNLPVPGLALPQGFRHELLSALIVCQVCPDVGDLASALRLHLIASHHGHCRPSAPVLPDTEAPPFSVRVDGQTVAFPGVTQPLAHLADGTEERFWTLTRHLGWWGLAYLELLLRLADQAVSARTKANPA